MPNYSNKCHAAFARARPLFDGFGCSAVALTPALSTHAVWAVDGQGADAMADEEPVMERAATKITEQSFDSLYEKVKVLGEGGFGEVHLVKDREHGDLYACKHVKVARPLAPPLLQPPYPRPAGAVCVPRAGCLIARGRGAGGG